MSKRLLPIFSSKSFMISDLAFGMSNTAAGTDWNTTGTFSCVDITSLMCLSGIHLRMTLWKCVWGRYWGILNFRKGEGSGVVVLSACFDMLLSAETRLYWGTVRGADSLFLGSVSLNAAFLDKHHLQMCPEPGKHSRGSCSSSGLWTAQILVTGAEGSVCARGSGAPSGDSVMNCSTSAMGANWDRQVYPNDTKMPGRGCLASLD